MASPAPAPPPAQTDIELNIGGKVFATTMATLTKVEGMLSVLVTTDIGVTRDPQGRIFVDRDPGVFSFVLNFLRTSDLRIPTDPDEAAMLEDDLQFYGLTDVPTEDGTGGDGTLILGQGGVGPSPFAPLLFDGLSEAFDVAVELFADWAYSVCEEMAANKSSLTVRLTLNRSALTGSSGFSGETGFREYGNGSFWLGVRGVSSNFPQPVVPRDVFNAVRTVFEETPDEISIRQLFRSVRLHTVTTLLPAAIASQLGTRGLKVFLEQGSNTRLADFVIHFV